MLRVGLSRGSWYMHQWATHPLLGLSTGLWYMHLWATHPLRVLVELVPDLEEIGVARQVPKVDSHRLAVHRDRLNTVIDANGRYILGHKLRRTTEHV